MTECLCVKCGSKGIESGRILYKEPATIYAAGNMVFKPDAAKSKTESIEAKACVVCGYISLFLTP